MNQKLKLIKLSITKLKGKSLKVINKILDKLFEIPFIEKPLPNKLSIKKNPNYQADTYYRLNKKATNSKNIKVEQFIKNTKFSIDNDCFNEV